MNKTIIVTGATVFGFIGSYIPFLFGVTDILSGWNILGSVIGGIFGIWIGVQAVKRWA